MQRDVSMGRQDVDLDNSLSWLLDRYMENIFRSYFYTLPATPCTTYYTLDTTHSVGRHKYQYTCFQVWDLGDLCYRVSG